MRAAEADATACGQRVKRKPGRTSSTTPPANLVDKLLAPGGPRFRTVDRALLVLLASRVRAWRQAVLIVRPDTLLRWHRQLFRGYRRRKSRATSPARPPRVAAETIALIRELAAANRLYGAERIRGEPLKLDIRMAKWTVQKYLRAARPSGRTGQTWATFLRSHARDLDLRLPAGHGQPLPARIRLLRDRARLAPRGARRRDAPPNRRLGSAAIARGDAVRGAAEIPHPR